MLGARAQQGDTIVEVVFSFAVFSLVVVSALVIMNQGVAMAQRSLEITLVRQQIDSQVTMVQQAQEMNSQAWKDLKAKMVDSPSGFTLLDTCPTATSPALGSGQFLGVNSSNVVTAYSADATNYDQATTYARVDLKGEATGNVPHAYGLWLILSRAENSASNAAYDLHVRACWASVGASKPIMIGTVVRLYAIN